MKALLALAFLLAAPAFADEAAFPPRRDDRPEFRPHLQFQCTAVNFFRQRFVARDWSVQRAQRDALRNCQRSSFRFGRCHVIGCARVR